MISFQKISTYFFSAAPTSGAARPRPSLCLTTFAGARWHKNLSFCLFFLPPFFLPSSLLSPSFSSFILLYFLLLAFFNQIWALPHLQYKVFSPSASLKSGFQTFRTSKTRFSALPQLQNHVLSPSASPKSGFQTFRNSKIIFWALPQLQNKVFSSSATPKQWFQPFRISKKHVFSKKIKHLKYSTSLNYLLKIFAHTGWYYENVT